MNICASIFPGHRFDFGDAVYIAATQTGGRVEGIYNKEGSWHYFISGHGQQQWEEEQLEPACANCFGLWNNLGHCPQCSFSYDD